MEEQRSAHENDEMTYLGFFLLAVDMIDSMNFDMGLKWRVRTRRNQLVDEC